MIAIAWRLVKLSDKNRVEIARVILEQKFWLKNSLSQAVEGATGRVRDRVEKQAVEGKDPQVEACNKSGSNLHPSSLQ